MASFDFVESASSGYKFFWDEGNHLLKLAFWPILIKILIFSFIITFELEDNLMRQGLILLPAYFAEGWLVAIAIRMALFDEREPVPLFRNKGGQMEFAADRQNMILAATLIYTLTKLVLSLFAGLASLEMEGAETEAPPPDSLTFITALIFLSFIVWAFRYLWLYIPAAMGYPVKAFIIKIKAFMTSIYMLGVWLLCFVPVALALLAISEFLGIVFPAVGGEPSMPYTYLMIGIQALLEILAAVIASVAMAYGMRELVSQNESDQNYR